MKFKLVNKLTQVLGKHEVGIRTGIIVVSTLSAVYFAIKDTPKIMNTLDELNAEGADNFTKFKKVAPLAGRTAMATAVSVGVTLASGKRAGDVISSLSSACSLAITAKDELEKSVERNVDPEKVAAIKQDIAKNHVVYDTVNDIQSIQPTGHGTDVFYDSWSGRYFYSDINYIRKAVNDLNYQLMNELWISLNEYYAYIGLPTIRAGEELGWNMDYGQIDLITEAELDDCERAYTIIGFKNSPCAKWEGRRW